MNSYYTYMYCREDGTPYYIGKGTGYRIHSKTSHLCGVPPKERRKYLKTNLTEEESIRHERYMIHVLGRKDVGTGMLRNQTEGGEGSSGRVYSEETLKRMSMVQKGRPKPCKESSKEIKRSFKWWNNGTDEKMSDVQPEGFVRGRLKSSLKNLPNHGLNLTDEERKERRRQSSIKYNTRMRLK
jgi:hypothetical protein